MWTLLCILLSVASNGVIGSIDESSEVCSACRKGSCKTISGLYTKPDLPQGYSLVTQIPAGACNIIVQQLMNTNNRIALKNSNGTFIINGDWKFSQSRSVESANTKFFYKTQDSSTKETIKATGPIYNAIDILLVTQQPNPGIKYDYSLPMMIPLEEEIAPPFHPAPSHLEPRRLDVPSNSVSQHDEAKPGHNYRRKIRKRFSWKISGVSPCSKSCGGGLQTTTYTCVREHGHTPVSDKRCSHLERPIQQQIRCNTQPCAAFWGGVWSACTGSCGQGLQHFVVTCQQDRGGKPIAVHDNVCSTPKPNPSSRPCKLPSCETRSDNEINQRVDSSNKVEVHEWKMGPWSQCSVSCGTGQRTRAISCPSGRCLSELRPPHAEYCDSGNCAAYGHVSPWLVSEWSHCSESCGTGTQFRLTICGTGSCESSGKPEIERACSSDRYCVGQWFIGPWGPCSESCNGVSKQTREVMCLVKVKGQTRIANDMTCSVQEKPITERACSGQCTPKWFVGEWGVCEGPCPAGIQRREMRCMEANGAQSNLCTDSERPIVKRSCGCERKDDQMNIPSHDEPQDHTCADKIRNCHLAVQARLCQYQYYNNSCCASCRRAPQEIIE